MSQRPLGPQNIDDFIMINDCVNFEWTKTDITLFWLLCLVAFRTEEFEDGTIDWLSHYPDLFWLDAVSGVALGLIPRMAPSPVAICGKFIDKKALQIIVCLVLTFNHVTNKLSQNHKNIVCIKKKAPSDPLTLAHVKTHNYDLDINLENNKDKDIMIPPLFLSSSILYFPAFVQSARDTDEIFHQLFSTLPVY